MGFPSATISIPFGMGLDTKTDPKQVQPGKLLALQNAVFTSRGKLKKRNGYNALGVNILGGGSVSVGHGIFTLGNELLMADTGSVYSYSFVLQGGVSQWERKGALSSISTTSTAVVRSQYQQTTQDGVTHPGGFQVYAWEDSSGGIRYSVVDGFTGQFVVSNALVSSSAAAPKVVVEYNDAGAGYVVILYARTSDNTLVGRQVTVAATTTLGSELLYCNVADLATSHVYDAVSDGSGTTWVAFANGSGTITVATRNSGGTRASIVLAGDAATAIAIGAPDTDGPVRVLVAYYTGTVVKFRGVQANLGASSATQTVETISGVTSLCVPTASRYSSSFQFLYTVGSSTTYNTYTKLCTATGYTANATTVFLRSVGLASKAWTYGSVNYVMVAFQSPLQSTYFAVSLSGVVVGRFMSTVGGGLPARWLLPEVSAGSTSSQFRVALLIKDLLTSIGGAVFTQTGVQSVLMDHYDSTFSFSSEEIANGAHVSGASLALYDGATVAEHGFHVSPEGLTVEFSSVGGALGGTYPASYQYAACYEWMDAQGQPHRSAPSTALTETLQATSTAFASTSSGSDHLTTVSPSDSRVFIGCAVSGTGIPAATTIIAQVSYGVWQMSAVATSTQTNELITVTPQFAMTGSVAFSATNAIVMDSVVRYLFALKTTAGSAVCRVMTTANLYVGQTVAWGYIDVPDTISSIDTTNNTITLGSIQSVTAPDWGTSGCQMNPAFTATSGSPNITVSAAMATYAAQYVGATFDATTLIAAGSKIVSAAGTTIVLSHNATGSGTTQGTIYFPAGVNLAVGNAIAGTTLPSSTTISAVSTTGGVTTVTASAPPIALGTSSPFAISNCFSAYVTVPTLRLTGKSGVGVALYRTTANGTVLYRQSSPTSPPANSTTADSVAIVDSTADVTITGNPKLYTTGAVLENSPCPPTQSLTQYRSRLVAIDQEDGSLWYSKQVVPGSPVEFSASLTLNVESKGGKPKCAAVLDDKLIIFKETSTYALAGDGPADTGANNDFTTPTSVATDTGCNNPHSIVLMPLGLMYQSAKGIYLLDRSLQARYIGEPVEAYNSYTVTSAVLVKSVNQVRFTLSSGIALVYDYVQDQWGTFTNIAAVQALNWRGTYSYLSSDGVVHTESNGYTDGTAFIPLVATTAWLTGAQLQGFQRVRRCMVLGDYASAHTLQVTVAYDYNSTAAQTSTFTVSSPPTDPYQYRVDFARRRCEAIQVTVQDVQSPATGEGMSLSALAFEIVPGRGLNRVAPTREA